MGGGRGRHWIKRLEPYGVTHKLRIAGEGVGRMRYVDGIRYANEHLQDQVVVLTNADLLLGEGFNCKNLNPQRLPRGSKMLIPVRKEDNSCPQWRTSGYSCDCSMWPATNSLAYCYDTYIFRAPLPPQLASDEATGFLMGGLWGAEQVFVAEVRASGVQVTSPHCNELTLYHIHCSQLRPHQKGPGIVAARTATREKQRVCYAEFCRLICIRPTTPSRTRWRSSARL